MVKCECGTDLKELYWSKFPFPDRDSTFIGTEKYWYCPKCEDVYEREIQTSVVWNKLQSLHRKASEEK